MTSRKQNQKADESVEKDETKKAGEDKSQTTQTTEQERVAKEETPTSVEERGETDADARGEKVGAVHDGDIGAAEEAADEVEAYAGGEVEGALGTVAERNLHGDEYDVPYLLLTADSSLVRTSDSDDPNKDWTAQHAGGERQDEDGNDLDPVALTTVQGTPGQTFRVSELPNREVVEAAGIDYEQWVATLPVRADVPDEAPRRGIPA